MNSDNEHTEKINEMSIKDLVNQAFKQESFDESNHYLNELKKRNTAQRDENHKAGRGGETNLEYNVSTGMYRATSTDSRIEVTQGEASDGFVNDARKRLDLLRNITDNAEAIDRFEGSLSAMVTERSNNLVTEADDLRFFEEANKMGLSVDIQAKSVAFYLIESSLHANDNLVGDRLMRIDSFCEKLGMEKDEYLKIVGNYLFKILVSQDFSEDKESLEIRTKGFDTVAIFVKSADALGIVKDSQNPLIDRLVRRSYGEYFPMALLHPLNWKERAKSAMESFEALPDEIKARHHDYVYEKIDLFLHD